MADHCDKEGAGKLSTRILAYWQARGWDVTIILEEAGFVPAMRSARVDIRSDMVNGWPIHRTKRTN